MWPGPEKPVSSPQNTPLHVMIVLCVLYKVLLNSLGFSAYMIKFVLKYYVQKKNIAMTDKQVYLLVKTYSYDW